MGYECRVERDSISPSGSRISSFIIRFPRIVLAENVTHRAVYDSWEPWEASYCERTTTRDISKNSASSRAIPFQRLCQSVMEDPFMPLWTANQKGMQGSSVEDPDEIAKADTIWLSAMKSAVLHAEELSKLNIHKQDVNRLLEPFVWVTQIVTASRWDNFFALRCDNAAHPALRKIARMMFLERKKSTPVKLEYGQWHLPFVQLEEQMEFEWLPYDVDADVPETILPDLIKFSAARCGWVSYDNADKVGTPEAMLSTFSRMIESRPVHACYDKDTDVLTRQGWKRWENTTIEDEFITLSKDGNIEYQYPQRLHSYNYSGEMVQIKTRHTDCLVTPNHNMYAARRTKWGFNEWKLTPVLEFFNASHKISMGGGNWSGPEANLDTARLLGFFVGDGCYSSNSVIFNLRKERKINYLENLVRRLGFEIRLHKRGRYVKCPLVFKRMCERCYAPDKHKMIPKEWMICGKDTLEAILEGLIESDGHRYEDGGITISTTSPILKDQIQEIALKCGMVASWRVNVQGPYRNSWGGIGKTCYAVCIFKDKYKQPRVGWTTSLRAKEVTKVLYEGKVYCATVPNGILYVRRKGHPLWCGNSVIEHQATPFPDYLANFRRFESNLSGWIQARKLIPQEEIKEFNPSDEEIASWGDV